jgi:transposase
VVDVEQWAEIRRMHFVAGLSIKEIARRMGRDRNTIRRALRSDAPPRYARWARPSKLDSFREEIHRLLGEDGQLPGQVVRERLQELGYAGGKTIVDDYVREIRPIITPPRTFQRTAYRPGEVCRSICGSRRTRSRSARSSTAAAGWWSRVWGTRAPARAR